MRRIYFTSILLLLTLCVFAQSPHSFQYQAVVRDAAGNPVTNQNIGFQISIISGSISGTVIYSETHLSSTNSYGIVTLTIGSGAPVSGTFSSISWGTASHFVKVEADPTGGTTYLDMGTTQLLSVPYALYAEEAGNVPTYSAGTGIDVTGTTITNTSPDQPVTITQGGATTVSGTYPNFTISSTDLNTGTPGGLNKTVQFNNNGSFGGDTALVWDNSNKRLGVGLTNPAGRVVIQGSSSAPATEPLFEVKDRNGDQVMVVYEDSVHFYIADGALFSNKGGFAVSGRNNSKQFTNNFLTVTPDSTRIYTGDTISGFGVENIGASSTTSYMHLTPNNYFIGHQAGDSVTTGMYNSFFGYKSGISNTTGSYNVLSGFRSGYLNKVGNYNTFLGHEAGFNNVGSDNTFIGFEAGEAHTTGGGNVYIGSKAGQDANNGSQNVFIGEYSGFSNTGGSQNVFIGYSSGKNNLTGNYNVMMGYECGLTNSSGGYNTMLGYQCGKTNTIGTGNIFMGFMAGYYNLDGSRNIFIGYNAGFNNTSGTDNTVLGNGAGFENTIGWSNVFIGETSGKLNTTGASNVFVGVESGYNNTTAGEGVFIGRQAGFNNQTGYANICIGSSAGHDNISGNSNLFVGAGAGSKSLSGYNVCLGEGTNSNNINGNHNVSIGFQSGINSTGSYNVFIGNNCGYDEIGSNKLFIENSSDITTPLVNGDFVSNRLAINRLADTYPFHVGTNGTNGNGAFLTTGGVWTNGSSRSFKDRFVDIDGIEILNKIMNLDLKGWYYKGTEEFHIGPFAEDFYEAFGTGVLNEKKDLGKYISTTDVSGVSLVAIKELIKQNEELKAQIEQLKADNSVIHEKLNELKNK